MLRRMVDSRNRTLGDGLPEGQQRQVHGDIADARVRPEDDAEGEQDRQQHHGLLVQLESQREQVEQRGVDLECVQE